MSINIKPSKRGSLHKMLHVPLGKTIPVKKLEAAKHSSNPALRKKANFALNARHFKHG
jgi:hypothetical protein